MWTQTALVASLATGLTIAAVSAQEALVSVDLSNLHTQMASNLDIEADEIPMTLQLPVSMAADVCGVGAESLSGACAATDMMWATHYAIKDIEGDPFSREDTDDDRASATGDVLLDAPGSSTNTAAQHGP